MTDSMEFLGRLVERFPELGKDYAVHVEGNGGALPHVFIGRVTQAVVAAYCCDAEGAGPGGSGAGGSGASASGAEEHGAGDYAALDWRGVLGFLEETFPAAPLPVRELIMTRFLMELPWPREPGYGLIGCLGPVLAWRFVQARPGG